MVGVLLMALVLVILLVSVESGDGEEDAQAPIIDAKAHTLVFHPLPLLCHYCYVDSCGYADSRDRLCVIYIGIT